MNSSASNIKARLLALVMSGGPRAIGLSGAWGSGKTHLWNELVRELASRAEVSDVKYSYLSLLGKSSVEEIYSAVFDNAVAFGAGLPTSQKSLEATSAELEHALSGAEQERSLFARISEWGRRNSGLFQKLPWFASSSDLINSARRLAIRRYLVCIDDLERRGTGLELADAISVISALVDQHECTVVVILNREGLDADDTECLKTWRDKALSNEIEYRPTAAENAAIAFSGSMHANRLQAASIRLGITNIRVLRRCLELADSVLGSLSATTEELLEQLTTAIVVAVWSRYDEGDRIPTLEFLHAFEPDQFSPSDKDASGPEVVWAAALRSVGYSHTDDLDRVILDAVIVGHVDGARLEQRVAERQMNLDAICHRAAYDAAWALFHDSYEENDGLIAERLPKAFIAAAPQLTLANLDATMSLLEDIDKPELARECEERWFSSLDCADAGVRRRGLYSALKHAHLEERFEAAVGLGPHKKGPQVGDVLARIGTGSSWSGSDEELLAKFSVGEIAAFILSSKDDMLNAWIDRSLMFGRYGNATETQKRIGSHFEQALREIGERSKLNALRVSRFRLTPRVQP